MNIPLPYLILIIVITVIVVAVICYYFLKRQTKEKIREASWETLRRNHPDLEKLFRKYCNEKDFFKHVDELMIVDNLVDFNVIIKNFIELYPDFEAHMRSLNMSNEETFRRFLNHRALAKVVFDSIKS